MNVLKHIRLIIFFVLFAFTVAGCVKEEDMSVQKEQTAIRILTTIEMSFPSKAKMRAGTVDESNGTYIEGLEDGSINESTVGTVRVLAFDYTTGDIGANILYVKPGVAPGANEKNYIFADGTGQNIFNIQMDLQIATGYYEFILIANEETSWNLGSITTNHQFKNSAELKNHLNTIVSEANLQTKVTANSGMPMMASAYINVPFVDGATEANPQIVFPTIKLKRTLAKVEVNLTNQDVNNGNIIFEAASVYKIKKVTLRNVNQRYNVLEGDAASLTETSGTVSNELTHNTGEAYTGTIISAYMAERKNITTEANAVTADITVEKAGEEITYSIPIYQNPATKDYSIYRNTLYRLNCILVGTALKVTLEIMPWQLIQSHKEFRPYTEMDFLPFWNPEPPVVKRPYDATAGATYDVAIFNFKLAHPIGGIWKATLTNGLEFAFEPGTPITGTSGIDYQIKIVALKPPATTTRTTEFYLMIEGQEVDPDNYIDGVTIVEGPKGIGTGNRYVITQSAQ